MSSRELRTTLRQLETLAAKLGVGVRYEGLKTSARKEPSRSTGRGGLVRFGAVRLILCDDALPVIDKIAVLAEALAALGVDSLLVPPVLRARIHKRPARPPKPPKLVLKPIAKARVVG